jgi:multiple antibiotic resistance protein
MSDFVLVLLAFIAAINPPAVALAAVRAAPTDRRGRAITAAMAFALALPFYIAFAAFADDMLDALDIEPESFRVAAGIVMATTGAYAVWRAHVAAAPAAGTRFDAIFPLALPILACPAGLVAAISYGADEGAGTTIAATAIPLAAAAVLIVPPALRWRPAADGLARTLGALLVAIAAGLIVDGVRAV